MPADVSSSSVAALLPAWQAAGFIQPTLDSLSAQTHGNFQVLVSVDLCDDGTHEICVAHAARDPRFRVWRQDQRQGYVGNCNFLLAQAATDYVFFAFHDDTLAPSYAGRLAAALDSHPEAVLSYSDMTTTEPDGTTEHWTFTALDGIDSRLERGARMVKPVPQWWVPNRGMFRLQAARQIRGLKSHGAGEFSADWPWLFHMSLLGQFTRVPETLCFKNYMPGSLSRSWDFTLKQKYEVRAACMRELWNSPLSTREKTALAAPTIRWLLEHPPMEES